MSRVPRSQEHLKTGFASEAAAAARFRACAKDAAARDLPNLARRFEALARAKDELAVVQLEAAGQVRAAERSVADALAEERYENDVLYPKMSRDADGETAAVFAAIVESQKGHLDELESLRRELQSAGGGDVEAG